MPPARPPAPPLANAAGCSAAIVTPRPCRSFRRLRGARRPAVERARILRVDHLPPLRAEERRNGDDGIVEVPVRIVAGVENAVPPGPLQDVEQVARLLRLLHGLGGGPHVALE